MNGYTANVVEAVKEDLAGNGRAQSRCRREISYENGRVRRLQ